MGRSDRDERRERVSGKRRAETHKSGFEKTHLRIPPETKMFTLDREGIRKIDVIPYKVGKGNPYADEGSLHFERTYWAHRGIGPEESMFICPAKTAKKPCPICEARAKMAKQADADEEMIKDLAPRERQLWNVVDLDDRDAGVQLFDISYHLFGKQLDKEIKNADEDDGYEYFADPEEGQSLKLGIDEKNFGGKDFYEVGTIGFKKRVNSIDEDVLKAAHCLDDVLLLVDYDKLKAVFLQTEDGDKGDEKPVKKDKEEKTKVEDDDDWGPAPTKVESKKKEEKKEEKPAIPTAQSVGLSVGDRVLHKEHGKCEVVKISGDGTSLTLEDVDGNIHKAVGVADIKTNPNKPQSKSPDDTSEKTSEKPSAKSAEKSSEQPKTKESDVAKPASRSDDDDWGNTPTSKSSGNSSSKQKETATSPPSTKDKKDDDWDNW